MSEPVNHLQISFAFWTILTSILAVGIGLLLFRLALKRRIYSRLIPGRPKWFIDVLGDLTVIIFNKKAYNGYPITSAFLQCFGGFAELYRNEKLVAVWLSYIPFVALYKSESVEEVLKSTNVIKKSWLYEWLHCWLGKGLLTSNGLKWKSRRKLLTPAFHFDILKDFQPIIHEKSMKLVKKFQEATNNDFINIITPLTLCSLDIICETTLGIDIKAQENAESEYVQAVDRVTDGIAKRVLSFWSFFDFTFFLTHGWKLKKDIKLLHAFTMKVIKEKKEKIKKENLDNAQNKTNKRKPLIDLLLEHHLLTKELTEEDIREEVDTFSFEGHDTTATAMVWTLYLIGLYKDVQLKIQKELDFIYGDDIDRPVIPEDLRDMNYLECVIKESMRLYPPVPMIGRHAEENLNICGFPIPKGCSIMTIPYSLHRNEDVFPNAEVFDPGRFTPANSAKRHHFAYVPFSAGPRNCIGQRLAMMELKTVLANVLRNFSLHSLDERDKLLPSMELILRPSGPVRVKITQRKLGTV